MESERRARYAARDVTDKLGLKPGQTVRVVGAGSHPLLDKIRGRTGKRFCGAYSTADVVLYWPRSGDEVASTLQTLKETIAPDGGIWVISAKRGKDIPNHRPYLPDTVLIPLGLSAGLVDNKICSISEVETAMRFVIRRKDRR
ncbi:MAG: DUF3052 family protein [Chloroflexi bacterium]|nr:DUF3052 family protein [Chloroflexota bacterium]MBI3732218.1 DUF3052 family protein [Chloroflexota bacterium]